MRRPNVLIVLADQWRASSISYAGDPDVRTPHLDRFAGEALDVRLAVSGCPVCCPARASLLTGLRPDRHGVFLNDVPLSPGIDSFPKRFAEAGYETAYIGKWHLDGHGRGARIPRERRHGFSRWKVQECTHDYWDSGYWDGDDPVMKRWNGYDAAAQADDLRAWLAERNADRPFLGVLAWGPPHNPYGTAPAAYRQRFAAAAMHPAPNVPPAIAGRVREDLAGYAAHIAALDDCLGRILRTLDGTGLRDDTIVIVTSDHGDLLGAHGLWDKQGPWDEAIRVPFLIRWPGRIPAGAAIDLVFDQIDVAPTICALAGVGALPGAQGRDRSLHLRQASVPTDNAALYASYHVFGNWRTDPDVDPLFAARCARGLRTARWTYVEDRTGPWLLYDDREDPHQMRNLIGRRADIERALSADLHRRLAAAGDFFADGWDLVRRWGYRPGADGSMPTTG